MADDWQTVGGGDDWQPVGEQQAPAKKFGLMDTWPVQLAKQIYAGVTLPGDVYQGKAAVPTSENNGENFDRVMGLSAVATPGTLGGVTKAVAPAQLTAKQLKDAGVEVFDAVKDVVVPVAQIKNLSAKITDDLVRNRSFRDTDVSAKATLQEIGNLVPPASVKSGTIGDLRSARMALQKYTGEIDIHGKATPNAVAARIAMNHIDDYLDTLAPEIKAANANYAAGSKLDAIDFRRIQAEHRAAKTGSGTNIENTMRQEVDKISDRGLSEFERYLKNQIVEGDATRNALRRAGKLGFGDGLSMLLHAGAALPSGGASVGLGIAATGARKLGEQLTKNDIAELARLISQRSPLYQSLPVTNVPVNPALTRGAASGEVALPQWLFGPLPVRADD